jgi:hypothetical protein
MRSSDLMGGLYAFCFLSLYVHCRPESSWEERKLSNAVDRSAQRGGLQRVEPER